jgi:hypothetical protein
VTGLEVELELASGNFRRAIVKTEIVDYRPVDTNVSVSLCLDDRASLFRAILGKNCYDDDNFVANMLIVMIEARFSNRVFMYNAYDVRVNVPNINDRYVEHPARGQDVPADLAGAVNDDAPLAKGSKVELKVIIRPAEVK